MPAFTLIDRRSLVTGVIAAFIGALGSAVVFVTYKTAQAEAFARTEADIKRIVESRVKAENGEASISVNYQESVSRLDKIRDVEGQSRQLLATMERIEKAFQEKAAGKIASELVKDPGFAAAISRSLEFEVIRFEFTVICNVTDPKPKEFPLSPGKEGLFEYEKKMPGEVIAVWYTPHNGIHDIGKMRYITPLKSPRGKDLIDVKLFTSSSDQVRLTLRVYALVRKRPELKDSPTAAVGNMS